MKKLLYILIIFLSFSFAVNPSVQSIDQPPSLDMEVKADSSQIVKPYNGIAETSATINLLPSGKAEENARKPLDIVFVVDQSGSMNFSTESDRAVEKGEKSRFSCSKEAVSQALSTLKLRPDDKVGMVTFNHEVALKMNLQTVSGTDDKRKFMDKLNRIQPTNGTNYTDSLKAAGEMLSDVSNKDEHDQYIIFLTDGEPTVSTEKMTVTVHEIKCEWFFLGCHTVEKEIKADVTHVIYTNGQTRSYYEYNRVTYTLGNINVPKRIRDHGKEAAEQLARENIKLLSIGFGPKAELDTSYLAQLSLVTKSPAYHAKDSDLIDYYEKISENLTSSYHTFANGYMTFSLPIGAELKNMDGIEEVEDNLYLMKLNDIKFDPDPPNRDDPSLMYRLPLTFSKAGNYSIPITAVYNGGEKQLNRTIQVKVTDGHVPLRSLSLPELLTITVGEEKNITPLIHASPADASNQKVSDYIKGLDRNNVKVENRNGQWYVIGLEEGWDWIQLVAEENYPSIFSNKMSIRVTGSAKFGDNSFKW